ncbi:hypothetical protein ScPMuIL_013397 [Solemya velum]
MEHENEVRDTKDETTQKRLEQIEQSIKNKLQTCTYSSGIADEELYTIRKELSALKQENEVQRRKLSNVMVYQMEGKVLHKDVLNSLSKYEKQEHERSKLFSELSTSISEVYKNVTLNGKYVSDQYKKDMHKWKAEIQSFRELWENIQDLKRTEKGNIPRVAFSSHMASSLTDIVDTTIRFKFTPTLNMGGAYHDNNGTFVAPVSGTYFFFSTILSAQNKVIETTIRVNGRAKVLLYSGDSQHHGSGSNAAILDLDAGDEVYMTIYFMLDNYVHTIWSTFSGFLLYMRQ